MTTAVLDVGTSSRRLRSITTALQWAAAIAVLMVAVGLAVARLELHVTVSSVLTGSMRPTFAPGDAVITKPVPVTHIRPGMVILATPRGETVVYAHRVTAVRHRGGSVVVQTKGDADAAPDRWQDVLTEAGTVPRVVGSIPRLGYVIQALHGHPTQRNVGPVAAAGLLVTLLACALILCTGPARHTTVAE